MMHELPYGRMPVATSPKDSVSLGEKQLPIGHNQHIVLGIDWHCDWLARYIY